MRSRPVISAAVLALLCGIPGIAQTLTNGKSANAGVNPIRLLDQKEVRVSRVEIQPGAVRSVHTHDDVRFHLWIPISGKLELTIGSAKPVEATSGQAFFFERGTPHGFKNVGDTPAAVIEVFVKDAPSAAEVQSLGVALAALAKRP
ncbi:MAG TPA: cupin domain-containing protein [Bryobacteraceae bacterium]|jgi:quercetin dioxygenase-like cupin family protein